MTPGQRGQLQEFQPSAAMQDLKSVRHSTNTDAREQDTDTREATMQDLKSVRHSTDTDTMEATMQDLSGA